MLIPNLQYASLQKEYVFDEVRKRVNAYRQKYRFKHLYDLGIGEVSQPLCNSVTSALHKAIDKPVAPETFHGYMIGVGAPYLRDAIAKHYKKRNVNISIDEIFISNGALDDLGDLLDLFDRASSALFIGPAYPAYVDTNKLAGRRVIQLPTSKENNFLALPDGSIRGDIIYISSPNNPTGVVYNREQLQEWVDYANRYGSLILFDASHEAFIQDEDLPHSIFEIEGSETCSIEFCSLSKADNFTDLHMGYAVIPANLTISNVNINKMWYRNRAIKISGISQILQRGATALFSQEGQTEIKEAIEECRKNAKLLMTALDRCGIWHCGGINSPYIWMECPNGMNSWDFFDKLINEEQIIGIPGSCFGEFGNKFFRLTSCTNTDIVQDATRRISYHLRQSR